MWPAEVTALEHASPLHLSVSLAWDAPSSYTHVHKKTERERDCATEGEEREVRRLFVASLLTGCWFGREPPKVVQRKRVCVWSPLSWRFLLPGGFQQLLC